jgi:hypothetical protein
MNINKEVKRIDDCLIVLGEYFDTVQIFVTKYEGDEGTVSLQRGKGNYYARTGQIRGWLAREEQEDLKSTDDLYSNTDDLQEM